jgi:hypothetical protein
LTSYQDAWYFFAEIYTKYKLASTTNEVESLHSIRRKWADKRLNFSASYKCRANLAILSAYLDNFQELVLKKLNIKPTKYMTEFFKVLKHC